MLLTALLALEACGCSARGTSYHALVDDAGGLEQGAAVRVAGVRVGSVAEVTLEEQRAKVVLHIDDGSGALLYADSCFEIRPIGLLGDSQVEVRPGSRGAGRLAPDASIRSCGGSASPQAILDQGLSAATSLASVLDAANSGNGTVARLLRDERLAAKFEDFLNGRCTQAPNDERRTPTP